MIAVDSSSLQAYLKGETGADVNLIEEALINQAVVLPPVVFTELLSSPRLTKVDAAYLKAFPLLSVMDGYWERAGDLRNKILKLGLKARLADVLIATSCVDHNIYLISRDDDFRHYAKHGRLKLAP